MNGAQTSVDPTKMVSRITAICLHVRSSALGRTLAGSDLSRVIRAVRRFHDAARGELGCRGEVGVCDVITGEATIDPSSLLSGTTPSDIHTLCVGPEPSRLIPP